jgi:hypothetical protein
LAVTLKSAPAVTVMTALRVRPLAAPETVHVAVVVPEARVRVRVKLAVAPGALAGPVQPVRAADDDV